MHIHTCTGVPPKPTNVSLSQVVYEIAASNVTVSWNQPTTGRIDFYIVNITSYRLESLSLIAKIPSVALDSIPYGQDVNITIISVNCYSESEGDLFVISIRKAVDYFVQLHVHV